MSIKGQVSISDPYATPTLWPAIENTTFSVFDCKLMSIPI